MTRKVSRGRPPTFTHKDRQYLAALIREHGIRGAHRRSQIRVSCHTLGKIAAEYGIDLKQGRRRNAA